jgi:dienelactone hydrolase
VGQGEWHLPGTLTLPIGGGGPFPAVVLVHGSGPEDRDESMGGPNKPFRDLAWGLASRGIAVLRYEKRTMQYAATFRQKSPDHFTVREETIDDALNAIAQLRTTKGIDPKHIFVLGHSMGGMLAPKIGQMDTNIAGLILLAGSNRQFEDVIVEQTRYLISLNGTPPDEGQAYLAKVQSDVAEIRKLTAADASASIILFGAQPAYWLDLRDYDPLQTAKQLRQRLLVLQGGRDYQVTEVDFNRWKEALGSQTNVTFKVYPKLNHQFITGEGKSTPDEYQQPGHVAELVVADIAEWISQRLTH